MTLMILISLISLLTLLSLVSLTSVIVQVANESNDPTKPNRPNKPNKRIVQVEKLRMEYASLLEQNKLLDPRCSALLAIALCTIDLRTLLFSLPPLTYSLTHSLTHVHTYTYSRYLSHTLLTHAPTSLTHSLHSLYFTHARTH
jgi:hypothetical protein